MYTDDMGQKRPSIIDDDSLYDKSRKDDLIEHLNGMLGIHDYFYPFWDIVDYDKNVLLLSIIGKKIRWTL
jgi:hypothetical protein